MKICFYWMNLATPPGMNVGVSLLAHETARAGHQVKLVLVNEKLGLSLEPATLTRHLAESFDLHALSFGQNHYPQALQLARAIKEAQPASRIICGGVHTTLNAAAVLKNPAIDFVGIGEADGRLVEFLQVLEDGGDPGRVPGFWYKRGAAQVHNSLPPLPDITEQTHLYLEGFDYRPLIAANRGFGETIVGRGCPMSCNYCHNAAIVDTYRRLMKRPRGSLGYCRLRSVANVMSELRRFQELYGDVLRAFNFGDDVFASDRRWLADFCGAYATEIGLPFVSNAIAGQIDERVAGLLAEAGCLMVKFGVESGSERVRRQLLNRVLDEKTLARSVSLLHRAGINTRAYVMLGMPGETDDEMQATVRLCAGLRFDSVRPAIFYPYPGTVVHRLCEEQGLLDESVRPTDYSTTTVLRLAPEKRLALEKTAALYSALLNLELGGEAARLCRPLVDQIMAMDAVTWQSADGRSRLREQAASIHERLRCRGVEHYYAPFADRPDVIFLYRQRSRPLLNVDE